MYRRGGYGNKETKKVLNKRVKSNLVLEILINRQINILPIVNDLTGA